MAIVGRARTATGAGVFATALLVLLFGNQAFTEWVVRHTDGNTVWGWFLRTLSWWRWRGRCCWWCSSHWYSARRPAR